MTRKCFSCGTPSQPYYKDKNNSLTQDHAAIFRDTQYAAGIEIKEQFVVPQLGEDIQVCVKNLVNVVVGSYIWNPAYGYLQIAHWDSCGGKIGLLNEDINGAAIPGTVVSAGSLFAVTARPCCADQDNFQLFPFLAEDYVIPAVSGSVTLAVTSTFGLIQGSNIRIGSNVYSLTQINSSLEIVVTNEGAGGTPGDIVQAKDVNGEYQYLIVQSVVSACTASGTSTVRLTGCDGATEAILDGDVNGQVPVLQDASTNEVMFQSLDTTIRTCTGLLTTLNVMAAVPSYTIDVGDESVFTIGEIVQINNGALRWLITDNTTPNELDITCTAGIPGSTFSVPAGSPVCLQLTTDTIEEEIATLELSTQNGWIPFVGNPSGTYVSASSFTVLGIESLNFLKIGQKLKFTNNGVTKYANILSFTFLFGPVRTSINILVNTDYVLVAGTITDIQFSLGNPAGFPPYFIFNANPIGLGLIIGNAHRYWLLESQMNIEGYLFGQSSSTALGITLPIGLQLGPSTLIGSLYQITNNTATDTIGSATAVGTAASFFPDQQSGLWAGGAAILSTNYKLSYIIDQ